MDTVLFSSRPPDSTGPSYGFPTMVQLDGSDYRVLDDADNEASFALPAPSPDGETVAYDRAGQAWLYRRDAGPAPFNLTRYGMACDPQLRIVSPAWSPDGRRIAWVIGDCRSGGCLYSLGVFDLELGTALSLHPYTPIGMGGQPPAPAWSPDGRWLAFSGTPQGIGPGLWLAEAETWGVHAPDLPPDAHPVAWVSSPGN